MTIQVREYATLTTDKSSQPSMDLGVITQATYDWLLDLPTGENEAPLVRHTAHNRLKLRQYVGYLQSPAGEGIEILPKTEQEIPSAPDKQWALLQRMLSASPKLSGREAKQATLQAKQQPIHEWIMGQFLRELAELVRRGLRFDYQTIEEECRFVRGQLNINRQLRQTPDKATHFHVRYAEFNPQRIENRLLRSALDAVSKLSQDNDNWRLAHTLRQQLNEIEPHPNPLRDLPRWDTGKQLLGYRAVKPWCQLILESLNPHFQQGTRQGIALLFPMEKLYENYLGHCLKKQLQPTLTLKSQAMSQHLLKHRPSGSDADKTMFTLQPDFLVRQGRTELCVLDAKWKLLDQSLTGQDKYKIKQADLYQMFAYGQKYLGGSGDMLLVYPKHTHFDQALPVFSFDENLRLWCVPFDLDNGCLVEGAWETSVKYFSAHTDTPPTKKLNSGKIAAIS